MSARYKFRALSEISRDIAQVFFASVVIAPILAGLRDTVVISLGMIGALLYWWLSILYAVKGKL